MKTSLAILSVASILLLIFVETSAFVVHSSGSKLSATTNGSVIRHSSLDTRRFNFFDNIGSMISNFGKEVEASHILIGPRSMNQQDAQAKLTEIKEEIGDDPGKFAEMAAMYSSCPTKKKGGDLGKFGPGMMVKPFDTVCFEEEVGVVHGPVSTTFGEHLILIRSRSGDDK